MTRRLIMLRHGQTDYNATRRMQGHLDTQLSEVGIEQARATADYLATLPITKVVASDLQRANVTAQIVAEKLGLPVISDDRLRETHLGEWQAKTHDEVDAQYPGARALWRHDATWAPPGGESRIDVAKRARPVVDELMRTYDDWDQGIVLLVAHGGVINALTSNLLELDVAHYPMFSGLGNTHWTQLTARPHYQLGDMDADGQGDNPAPSAIFTPENIAGAQWYLDSWNSSAIGD